MLLKTLSGVPRALMQKIVNGKHSKKGKKYPPQVKAFALTLQFYSTKAYEFVRKTFDFPLPCKSHIRKCYAKIDANPGEKYSGYVDLGYDIDDDSTPVAKDALVFMVVSINCSWKVPCGYFFINGLTASERANLIRVCIQRLSDIGIKVVSITCDGLSCHFSKLAELGASLKVTNMVPSFSHPLIANEKIFVLLDVCHMLKLMRNTLAEKGILFDSEKKNKYEEIH